MRAEGSVAEVLCTLQVHGKGNSVIAMQLDLPQVNQELLERTFQKVYYAMCTEGFIGMQYIHKATQL